ncbi:MAG: hypothetical protein KBD94_11920 [Pyrinomonadaceae bacterium]|nr:hypothetical protein [Pyrinomonadaceae bacterium]
MHIQNLRSAFTTLRGLLFVLFLLPAAIHAQATFKPGDRVEVSPMMLKADRYYQQCRVVNVDPNGSSYTVNCSGTEYVVGKAFVRSAANAPAEPDGNPPAANGTVTGPQPVAAGAYKVGARVLASVSGLKGEKYYRPCTVKGPLKNNAYSLRCDAWRGMLANDFAVRPDWIKTWDAPTPEPATDCPFTKAYAKPARNAAPSAALFKSVIFHQQNAVQDFYDFGVTFMTFSLGRVFKNSQVSILMRDVDTAPLGTTIHDVKTREMICQKSSTIIKRWIRDIGYACYKDGTGEWACKNGAPKYIEQTSIPID